MPEGAKNGRTDGAEDVDGNLDGTQDGVFPECRGGEGEEVRNRTRAERVGIRNETNGDVEKPDWGLSLARTKDAVESFYASDTDVLRDDGVLVRVGGGTSKVRLTINGGRPFARMSGLGIVLRVAGGLGDHRGRTWRGRPCGGKGTVGARHRRETDRMLI